MMDSVTASSLKIVVNGQARTAPSGATVESFLLTHDLDPALVVVERNGEILARPAFPETALEPGDRLEIVHFVGGG